MNHITTLILSFLQTVINTVPKSPRDLAKLSAYSKVKRELNAMSDRDLLDIGLTRGDIEDVARTASKV